MSRKFLVPIDLVKNELQNAVIQNLATAPATPVAGQIYYDTVDNILYFYDGAAWISTVSTGSVILYDTIGNRPVATSVEGGTLFFATDTHLLYLSDAATWSQISQFGVSESTDVAIDGTAADGTSTDYARADHEHGGPGFGSVEAQTTYGGSSANGSATTVSHSDHTHGTVSLSDTNPQDLTISGTASAGTGSTPSRDDHVHAGPGFGSPTAQTSFGESSSDGSATTVPHSDHTHGTPTLDVTAIQGTGLTISDLDAPTADVDWATYKITGLGDPSSAQDAATKAYVDSVAQGLDVKASVYLATTGALTPYTFTTTGGGTITNLVPGPISIDGVTPSVADRILIKNETSGDAPNNGIYVVTTVGDGITPYVLTRSADANTSAEVTTGMFTFVEAGSSLSNTGWVLTTANPITLNTTGLTFTQFSGAGTYTAGNGIDITGQVISVDAGNGLDFSGSALVIDTAVVVRKYAANVGDNASTSIAVTHDLGTRDIQVTLYDNSSPYAEVTCDVQHTSTTVATLLFSVAPTTDQYRVVVHA